MGSQLGQKSGYDIIFHQAIDVAASFYFVLGLFFIYKLLNNTKNQEKIALTLLFATSGTNLLYYAIWETGMSHVYSFSLFAILLFLLSKKIFSHRLILISLIILIVRPINIVFLMPILVFFDVANKNEFGIRIRNLVNIKNFILTVIYSTLLFSPQLMYNNYAFGSWKANSYQNEGFTYLNNPKILEILFAPNNGLFLYAPILAVLFVAIILKFEYLKKVGYLPILLLAIYTIMYASWWSYTLGCGFGHRGFVDILPVFIYSLFHALNATNSKFLYALIFVLCLYTMKLTFSYDSCFYGKWDWDWQAYQHLILTKVK